MTSVVVYPCDHVRGEINDLFEVFGREIEQITQAAGHALEIPDVRHRRGELDVTHPFAPNLGASELDSAAFADDALEADALVFTAIALHSVALYDTLGCINLFDWLAAFSLLLMRVCRPLALQIITPLVLHFIRENLTHLPKQQ